MGGLRSFWILVGLVITEHHAKELRKLDQWFLRYSNFIFRRRRVMAYPHLAYPMGTPHLAYPGPSGTCI